jgi:hypothetical protein
MEAKRRPFNWSFILGSIQTHDYDERKPKH